MCVQQAIPPRSCPEAHACVCLLLARALHLAEVLRQLGPGPAQVACRTGAHLVQPLLHERYDSSVSLSTLSVLTQNAVNTY